MTEVIFETEARHANLGRNGYSRAKGVHIDTLGDCLFLRPINSRGDLTQARIVVPIVDAQAFLAAIATALTDSAVQPDDNRTKSEAVDSLAARLDTARLTKAQALALPVGALVHVLHENCGADQNDDETVHPAGAIARVDRKRFYEGAQGHALELCYPTGVYGTWDEEDPAPYDFALAMVTRPDLIAEASAAFAAFNASPDPTPAYPTPILDALIGPAFDMNAPEDDAAPDADPAVYPWLVTDEETHPRVTPLARFASEDLAAKWISAQTDAAKVHRGGYGLEGPDEG